MRRVLILNAVMMAVEIVGGLKLGSMALYADGWHMATHVTAFLIAVCAYAAARRNATNASFTFGTGKISVLGAFTSAIVLGGIAVMMAVQSGTRLRDPLPIHFNEAIIVAGIGLGVNLISALMLKGEHHHHHRRRRRRSRSNLIPYPSPERAHHHDHHHDLNMKAAYVHVLADAVTSLLAIGALVGGKILKWVWLDPAMGLIGSALILAWSVRLVRDTHVILLDKNPEESTLSGEIRRVIQSDSDAVITDLHVWQVASNKFAAIISVMAHDPKPPAAYKELLRGCRELVHVTVEVNPCTGSVTA